MSLLQWIEGTSLAEYIRVALYAYPAMITLHSLGLAIMVGLSCLLSLRVLGFFKSIPFVGLEKLLKVAWVGFVVNFISGGLLFTTQATTYVTDREFLIKMTFVVLGASFVAMMQSAIKTEPGAVGRGIAAAKNPSLATFCAYATIVSWTIAMVAGRLIAYM